MTSSGADNWEIYRSNRMGSELAQSHAQNVARLNDSESREQMMRVLKNSLYVGARDESVAMVLDYCKAGRLDPMQKPVHLVPMRVKDPESGQYAWRDVVMPGIGLYRIQADRSGTLAGITAPEFGPMVEETFTDKDGNPVKLTFPEWCRITVRKLIGGHIVDFTACEFWVENYATDSGRSSAPNAMWRKRPRGQLAKCAEAQALRKAFPEIGASPTAEEMEGKSFESPEVLPPRATEPAELPEYPADKFEENLPKWQDVIDAGKKSPDEIIAVVETRGRLTESQKRRIRGEEETTDADA